MRFGERYSLRELRDHTREAFITWYDSALPTISAVEHQANRELFGFAQLLQPHQLVKLSIRRKSVESFADKIQKSLHDPAEFKKLQGSFRERIGPEHLIKDLIGARFIMYSGPDQLLPIQFFSFRQEFVVNELRLYSIYNSKSPFFSHDILDEIKRLYPNVPIHIGQKPSGYESIHAIVRFNPNYLRMKLQADANNPLRIKASAIQRKEIDALRQLSPDMWGCMADLERRQWPRRKENELFALNAERTMNSLHFSELHLLDKIDFELQVRTALQDNWAQIEHRLRYSLDKSSGSTGRPAPNRDLVDQAFKAQTVMTSALEKNQYLVLQIDEQKYSSIALSIQTLSPGKRGVFFEDDQQVRSEFSAVESYYTDIDAQITDSNGPRQALVRKVTHLLSAIETLGERCKINFRKFTTDDDVMKWGKRRYILLMLGYLLIRGSNDLKERIVSWFHVGDQKTQMPRDTYFATTYLYDHVGFLDTNFRNKKNRHSDHFFDPLVNYRTAGLAVQRREFLIAIRLLDEARHFLEIFRETLPQNLRILNHARFERRCGQYFWWAYLTNRQENVDEIYRAIERMKKVLSMKPKDVICYQLPEASSPQQSKEQIQLIDDILRREQRSAALNLIVYTFFRFVIRKEGHPNWDGFDAEMKPTMELIRSLFPAAGTPDYDTYINSATPTVIGQMFLVQAIEKAIHADFQESLADIDRAIGEFSRKPVRLESSFDRVEVAGEIRRFLTEQQKELRAAVRHAKPAGERIELVRQTGVHL